jgi:hypothetical protein
MIFGGVSDSKNIQNSLKLLLKDSAFNSAPINEDDFKKLEWANLRSYVPPSSGLPSLVRKNRLFSAIV